MVSGKYDLCGHEVSTVSRGNDSDVLLRGPERETIIDEADVAVEKLVPKAPDGGYGWVIVAAAFFCNFIVDGIAYSGSVYLRTWSEVFPEDGKDKISWVLSLLGGVYLCMGPIASALTNAFGFRIVILSGAFITAAAFVGSAFCQSIGGLIGVFGITGGIGFGLIYSPSILCVCYYFDKRRAMAVGICVCGSGVGALAFPPLTGIVVEYYGWEGSMFVLAGLVMLVCIAGALMKTLTIELQTRVEVRSGHEEVPLMGRSRASSFCHPSSFRNLKHIKPPALHNRNDPMPDYDVEIVHSRKCYSTHGIDVQAVGKAQVVLRDASSGSLRHYFSTPDISQDIRKIKRVEFLPPFARKDIVLQGSMKHLDRAPEEKSEFQSFNRGSQSSVNYRTQVTETVVTCEPAPAKKPALSFLPPELRQALMDLSDLNIYKNGVFLIFSLASFFGMIAFNIPFMFIPDFARLNYEDISEEQANLLISAIGATSILGRLFWGWLSDRPGMDPLIVHNCAVTVVAVVLAFVPACMDYYSLMFVCALFGFFVSPFISLMAVILTSRIRLDQLPSAFGQSQLVRGVAAMVGAPFGGFLYEQTQNYSMTFWVASTEFVLAVAVASIILINEFMHRRRYPAGKSLGEVCA